MPALPVLAFGLARVWEREKARPFVFVAGMVSVLGMLGITAVGIEAPETGDVIREFVLPRLRAGEISAFPSATNLGLLFGLPPFLSLVPWLAWLAIFGRILWRRAVAEEQALVHEERLLWRRSKQGSGGKGRAGAASAP